MARPEKNLGARAKCGVKEPRRDGEHRRSRGRGKNYDISIASNGATCAAIARRVMEAAYPQFCTDCTDCKDCKGGFAAAKTENPKRKK